MSMAEGCSDGNHRPPLPSRDEANVVFVDDVRHAPFRDLFDPGRLIRAPDENFVASGALRALGVRPLANEANHLRPESQYLPTAPPARRRLLIRRFRERPSRACLEDHQKFPMAACIPARGNSNFSHCRERQSLRHSLPISRVSRKDGRMKAFICVSGSTTRR